MRCLIKNIPLPTFGIAGNRGVGFPLTSYCFDLIQPIVKDVDCYLVKEEDGFTSILTDVEKEINSTCADPETNEVCYIVLQEDININLIQEEGDVLFCSDNYALAEYYLFMQDGITPIVDQESRELLIIQL